MGREHNTVEGNVEETHAALLRVWGKALLPALNPPQLLPFRKVTKVLKLFTLHLGQTIDLLFSSAGFELLAWFPTSLLSRTY